MRVKRGVTKRARKNKTLELAKGYRMTYSKLYRRAKEAVLHAGQYNYAHRRRRGSQMKEEWIKTISASLINYEISYSKFIDGLKKKNIAIDRKNIAELAIFNKPHFEKLVGLIK